MAVKLFALMILCVIGEQCWYYRIDAMAFSVTVDQKLLLLGKPACWFVCTLCMDLCRLGCFKDALWCMHGTGVHGQGTCVLHLDSVTCCTASVCLPWVFC